jgi:hypothetical protein
VALTLAEQLIINSQSTLKKVEIYSPPVEEDTVIQEENTDPTPG